MIALVYDTVLSRVQISVTGVNAAADHVLIERSTNQINWTTVRGGTAVPVVANTATLDDYEFSADVLNYYRASAVDTAPITFVAAGVAATGNNASVIPGLPAGIAGDRDTLYTLASIRNSGTGTVNVPAGWTAMVDFGNVALLGRKYNAAGEGATLNANPNLETDAANWTVIGGTLARSTVQAHQGVASLLLTPDGVSATPSARTELVACAVGSVYRMSAWVRCAVARTVKISVLWHTGGGAFVSRDDVNVAVPALTWTLLDISAVAPATGVQVLGAVEMDGTPPGSHLLYIDEARVRLGVAPPTVTFAGGVANADTIAQMVAFRNAELAPTVSNTLLNGSAQDIAHPALSIPDDNHVVLVAGWKQDDWTSVATLAGMTEIGEPDTTTGDDAGQVWDYVIQTAAANIAAGSFVVTGGASAISRAIVAAIGPAGYLNQETASITPTLTEVWLKSVARPFLNRTVTVKDLSGMGRPSRTGAFAVVGRSLPVAVTDVRGGKQFTLDLHTYTPAEATDVDLVLASGDILFLQAPTTGRLAVVPTGYVAIGGTVEEVPDTADLSMRVFSLPCTMSAPPGPDVIGALGTWQTVLSNYATWSDVLAAFPDWASLLQLVGSPADVIVS